jgi:GntR family transcriptional repressor for pyruvate dehydrogenase complex
MALRAVKLRRIHEEIVAQIREQLAEGQLKPGDQLPSERDLAEQFQVSRASVREAMRALEFMGLVKIKSGDGTYVASSVDCLLSPLSSTILRQDLLHDVFEARKLLEPEIAALAAKRAGPQEIEHLEAILTDQAQQIAAGESGVEADTAFHSMLAQAARNTVFLRLNESIVDSLRESRERSLRVPGRAPRSLEGHRAILKAIRSRNAAQAKRAMLVHLTAMEQNILRSTGNNDGDGGGERKTNERTTS